MFHKQQLTRSQHDSGKWIYRAQHVSTAWPWTIPKGQCHKTWSNFTQFHKRSTLAHPSSLQQGGLQFLLQEGYYQESEIQRSSCKPLHLLQKLSSSDRRRIDALRPESWERGYMLTYSHQECHQHLKQTPPFPLCRGIGLRGPVEKMIAAHKTCMLQNQFPVAFLAPSVNCS